MGGTAALAKLSENARSALMVILSLDEDLVVPVLKHLDPEDIRTLHSLSNSERSYSQEEIFKAYEQFIAASSMPMVVPGSEQSYIERLTQRSLGREDSKEIFEAKGDTRAFAGMEKHNPATVARILSGEDSQVIAAVLSELPPAYSAAILSNMAREQRAVVMHKLANLESIPRSTFDLLRLALDEQLADLDTEDAVAVDGVGRVSSILQRLSKDDAEDILMELEDSESTLAQQLRREMFNFEGLLGIQGRGMQSLIKEISNDQLLLALKTCSDELKDKFLSSVSKRAAEVILDDLSIMGPVRLSEVENAQQEIVDTALRMEAESKIVISGRGGEELV